MSLELLQFDLVMQHLRKISQAIVSRIDSSTSMHGYNIVYIYLAAASTTTIPMLTNLEKVWTLVLESKPSMINFLQEALATPTPCCSAFAKTFSSSTSTHCILFNPLSEGFQLTFSVPDTSYGETDKR
jgi:hypothetical protein